MYNFFAMMSRMKYIDRWALMRSTARENVSEHSLEVSMLAHALAIIGNCYCGKQYDASRAALLGLYHDATEIVTGDMPTPIKYYNPAIRTAYKEMEAATAESLLAMLPPEMQSYYAPLLHGQDEALGKLIKAADKLSAYIKCVEEEKSGNTEFSAAKRTTHEALMAMNLPEVQLFFEKFADAYGATLDALHK